MKDVTHLQDRFLRFRFLRLAKTGVYAKQTFNNSENQIRIEKSSFFSFNCSFSKGSFLTGQE